MAEPVQAPLPGTTYREDGTTVPPAEIGKAVASGQARWRKGEMVPFVAPDGSGYRIPAEQAQERAAAGWTPVSPEHFEQLKSENTPGSLGEVAAATALGVADIPSLGTASGLVSPETQRRLQTVGKTAFTVGQVLGTAATMGLGGGARAGVGAVGAADVLIPGRGVARAAAAAGEGLAARLPGGVPALREAASAAVTGGIEGGAYTAGKELARVAQGDEDFNAEVFASQVGRGALTGAAFGGGAGAAIGLTKHAAGGLGKAYKELTTAASEAGEDLAVAGTTSGTRLSKAQKQAVKAAGVTDLKKAGAARAATYGQDLLDSGIISKDGAVAAAIKGDITSIAGGVAARQKALGKAIRAEVYEVADELATAGAAGSRAFVDVTKLSPDLPNPFAGSPALARKEAILKPLNEQLGELRRLGGAERMRAADKLEADWLEPIKRAETFVDLHKIVSDIQASVKGANVDKIYGAAASHAAGTLKDSLREALKSVDEGVYLKGVKLDELYSAYAQLSPQTLKAAAQAQKVGAGFSPFDTATLLAGAASGNPLVFGFGVAKVAAQVNKNSTRLAAAKARFFEGANAAVSKERIKLFTDVSDAAKGAAVVVPRLTGRLANAAVAGGFSEKAQTARESTLQPERASATLQRSLAPLAAADAPRAAKVAEIRLADLQWLSQFLDPHSNLGNQPFDLIGKSTVDVPPSVAASFLRAQKAIDDPIGELKGIKDGSPVSPETVQVIRERRPKLREVLKNEFDRLSAELADDGKAMSYETRITASILTGKPYDVTMKPEMVSFVQKTWAGSGVPVAPSLPQPGEGSGRRPTRPQRERLGRFRTTAEDVMDYSHE